MVQIPQRIQIVIRQCCASFVLLLFAGHLLIAQSSPKPAPTTASRAHASHYAPNPFPTRAVLYYKDVWGIDGMVVRSTESGELVRFSYRVLDPDRAAQLNDKKVEPTLVDPQAGVSLVIPSLEKVGQLRQSITPEAGKTYWMAFSNPHRNVKKGDHVSIVIGRFHADNILVE